MNGFKKYSGAVLTTFKSKKCC